MIPIKGGGQRRPTRKTVVPKYNPEDEATAEDLQKAVKKPVGRPAAKTTVVAGEVPRVIKVKATPALREVVPGSVWKQSPFRWDPVTFACESDKLIEHFVEPSVQNNSLRKFIDDPATPMIYGVTGNPDDMKAKLFAAFLVDIHQQKLGLKANVLWHVMYGGFENSILKEYDLVSGKEDPTMLVICNLTPNSPNVKLDKTRDLMARFENIPIVIVAAGEDPMSFLTTRLYSPIHGLAYFSENLVKKKVEII